MFSKCTIIRSNDMKMKILKNAIYFICCTLMTTMLSGCCAGLMLEHTGSKLTSNIGSNTVYILCGIWIIAIGGLLFYAWVGSPFVKEHKQEIEIDGETHVIHDKSKDEYEYPDMTDKEQREAASRAVGWCVYLFALYWIIKFIKTLVPSLNLLWIVLISAAYIAICCFIDKYIYKVWKYVLYGCWGFAVIDLIITLIIWLYNTTI